MARTVASHLAEQVQHQPCFKLCGVPISEVFSSQASPLRKVKITSKVPRKLPKLAARRPEGLIEKVMPSASNVEKVGIPLPKVKEKVEKRGKYLKAVVDSLVALGQGGKGRSYAGIVSRMQMDFPDFPWDNKPVIKKHVGLALKVGVEEGVLVQQVIRFPSPMQFPPLTSLSRTGKLVKAVAATSCPGPVLLHI